MLDLKKGQLLDLKKADGTDLSNVHLGLSWDLGGKKIDVDVFVVDLTRGAVAFYNNRTAIKGVFLSEDNRDGAGDGDDEFVDMDARVTEDGVYALCIDIHEAKEKGFDFSQVLNPKVSILNKDTGEVIATYNLDAGGAHTACIVGMITDTGNKYSFEAKGDYLNGDINDVVAALGVK